jgi:hypothetical protein
MERPPSRKSAKAKTKTPERSDGKKERVVTQRAVAARIERYHALFSAAFRDSNPKKRYLSHAGLAGKLGYSKSMVRRDIELMQIDYGLPLEVIEQYGGWGYTEQVLKAPTVRMTKSDLVLICTAWSALEGARGTPLADRAAATFEKLIEALGPDLGVELRKVRERISFRATNYYAAMDPKVFETVSEALLNGEEMEFDYRKLAKTSPRAGSAETSSHSGSAPLVRRYVQPRHLLNHDGAWYLYTDDLSSAKSHEPSAKWGAPEGVGNHESSGARQSAEGSQKGHAGEREQLRGGKPFSTWLSALTAATVASLRYRGCGR